MVQNYLHERSNRDNELRLDKTVQMFAALRRLSLFGVMESKMLRLGSTEQRNISCLGKGAE